MDTVNSVCMAQAKPMFDETISACQHLWRNSEESSKLFSPMALVHVWFKCFVVRQRNTVKIQLICKNEISESTDVQECETKSWRVRDIYI